MNHRWLDEPRIEKREAGSTRGSVVWSTTDGMHAYEFRRTFFTEACAKSYVVKLYKKKWTSV